MLLKPNKFYVYAHKIPETGQVFYIGMGTLPRVFEVNKAKRLTKGWLEQYNKSGILVEILKTFDTRKDALNAEIEFIKYYKQLKHPLINITNGGAGMLGVAPWNKGKVLPNYVKTKISKKSKELFQTEKQREVHSRKCGGKKFQVLDKITCKIVWEGYNQSECARTLGLNQGNIANALRGERTIKNYNISFIEDVENDSSK